MRAHLRPFLSALVVAGILLAGCGSRDDEPAAVPDDTETVTDDAPIDDPTGDDPTGDDPTQDDPATDDGTPMSGFGFVVDVSADGSAIAFDAATWVSDDAEPNGYRIDNSDRTAVDLTLAEDADVVVLMATGDPTTETTVDGPGLAAWFAGLGSHEDAAFDVTVEDGVVTAMAFRYRP